MPFSVNTAISDGVDKQFAVNFSNGIFAREFVKVYVEDDVDGGGNQLERSFTWINDGLIELDVAAPSGKTVTIRRILDKTEPTVDFADGAILNEANLDEQADHLLGVMHEVLDGYGAESIQTNIDMNGHVISNIGTDPDDPTSVPSRQEMDDAVAAAEVHKDAAALSAFNAATSETNATNAAGTAQTAATNANTYATNAAISADAASTSAQEAADTATALEADVDRLEEDLNALPVFENSLLHNRDLDNAVWSSNTTHIQDQVGIDGSVNTAWTVTDTSIIESERPYQDVSISDDNARHTFSVYVKKTVSATARVGIQMQFRLGGVSKTSRAFLNTNNGSFVFDPSFLGDSLYVSSYGDWWLVAMVSSNNDTGNTSLRALLYPTMADLVTDTNDVTLTGSCVIDVPQVFLNTSEPPKSPDVYAITQGYPAKAVSQSKLEQFGEYSSKLGRKNLIINGNFDIWQRGTSGLGATTANYYAADRWNNRDGDVGKTVARTTLNLGPDATYGLLADELSAGYGLAQGIELPAAGAAGVFQIGKTFSVSFYAHVSTSRTFNVVLVGRDASGSSTNQQAISNVLSVANVSGSVSKIAGQLEINADVNPTNLVVDLVIYPSTDALSTTLSQVQLEEGPIATSFEYRPIAEELALCQRYYQEIPSIVLPVYTSDTTKRRLVAPRVVSMRTTPTIGGAASSGNYTPIADKELVDIFVDGVAAGAVVSIANYTADAEL